MATEPERVLPDMAADITLNAYEATVQTIQQQMPRSSRRTHRSAPDAQMAGAS
jgi:hypothetical protein